MPQIVETDVGEIEFPDDYTQDQMRDVLRSRLPVFRERLSKGRVSDLASRLPRDVAVSGADTLQGLARGWQQLMDYGRVSGLRQMGAIAALTSPVGEEHAALDAANAAADEKAKELEATREERLKQNPLYKFGEESAQNAREFYKTNPTFDQSIPAMLSQAIGSTVPVVASALTGPAAPYVGGLLYGAQSGQQGAKEAIEKGQPEKADEAYLAYAGLGAISEALMGYPIAFLRKVRAARQAGVSPDEFGKSLLADVAKRGVREAVEGFAREGTQESLEQIGQNISAREIGFDPERPVTQGAGQAFLIGGAVGAGLGGVGGAAMAIDEASPKAQLGRELERMGQLDFDPRTLDAIATGALSPQNATRTVVPAMLDQTTTRFIPPTEEQRAAEAAGLPIPITPAPVPEAPRKLTAAEEAAIAAGLQLTPHFGNVYPRATPPPAAVPVKIFHEDEVPAITAASATVENSGGFPFQPESPTPEPAPPRRRSAAPRPEEERATRVPKNGTKVTPPSVPISENAQLGYTPDALDSSIESGEWGTALDAGSPLIGLLPENPKDLAKSKFRTSVIGNLRGAMANNADIGRLKVGSKPLWRWLNEASPLTGPPEARTADETSVVPPEAQEKGVAPQITVQAPALLDRLALEAVGGDQSKLDDGRRFALSGEYTYEAISKAVGSTDRRAADLLAQTGVLTRTASGNYALSPDVYANEISRLTIKPAQPQEPNAIPIRSLTAIPEPSTLPRASQPDQFSAGTQTQSGINRETAANDVAAITRRNEEAANAWLQGVAGNDQEAIRNAETQFARTPVATEVRNENLLASDDTGRQAIRTSGSDVGAPRATTEDQGARPPQKRGQLGQPTGELGTDESLRSFQTSFRSSRPDGGEASRRTVGTAIQLLQDLSDQKKQARSAGDLLRLLQEDLPRLSKIDSTQIRNAIYASLRLRIAKTLSLRQTPESSQTVVPQIRDAEEPAAPQKTPQAQWTVDWFANLGSVSPEDVAAAKEIRRDIQKLSDEATKLEDEMLPLRKKIEHQGGPKWQRGRIKKSAKKSDVSNFYELQDRHTKVIQALNDLRSSVNPADIESTIRSVSDETRPLLARLNARAELFGLQGQREPEEFLAELDRVNREEVRRLFPDASPAEVERLRGPVRRAFMGRGDIESSMRLDPELNLNNQRWGEVNAVNQILTGGAHEYYQEYFPEDLRAKLAEVANARIAGKPLPSITRAETERLLIEIPQARAKAQAAAAEEQRQAAEASAKMEREFTKAIKTESASDAKQAKAILVRELESALAAAPDEQHGKAAVTIEIPGDGTFRILNNKSAIQTVLDNARKLSTATTNKNFTSRGISGEQAKQFAEEARMTPEEIAEFEASRTRPTAKYSVTLSEPPGAPAVTPADIESAFPEAQGFEVKPVGITMNERDGSTTQSTGYLVMLPNREAILIDPNREIINFDLNKAAADWGFDPQLLAERGGIARGAFYPNGVSIEGLSRVGLIELIRTADASTLSHEKFHALFSMALTPGERTAILNRYNTEEKAAEAFRRSEGFTRGFWEKMRRFIEWLANFVRGDAFRKLRAPLSATPSQPTGRTEPQFSLQEDSFHREIFRSKATLERFMAKPFHSAQERDAIREQASAQSAIVPDAIANEIKALDPTDDVEKRIADLLDFVVQLHGMAPALELKRILESTIDYDVKQAAISGVLRQIEHVRVKTDEIDDQLQIATRELASASKKLKGNVSKQDLIEARAKRIADNLIDRYRQYLTAQAANLPNDQNLAAARSDLLSRMDAMLVEEQKLDVTHRALNAIAQRIGELPVAEGPAAVVQAIRDKGILRGVVGDDTIDLLTAEKPGGLPPLLLHPAVNDLLIGLADVQKRGELYAKQIDAIEKAFRGKTPGEPATSAFDDKATPVTLRKWADTYLKFRNQQKEAARAIADLNADFEKADQNVQVYGRSKDILTRLQNDPAFVAQFNAAINRPGGSVFGDIAKADENTGELTYISPLKIKDENGKEHQNTFKVSLRPDRKADQQTVTNMADLVLEIEQYLAGENVDPLEARTWRERMDYLKTYMLNPKFQAGRVGGEIETTYGTIRLNLWDVRKTLMGGAGAAPRSELERVPYRATRGLNNAIVAGDLAAADLKRQANNLDYGDEATTQAIIKAAKSHGWDENQLLKWNQTVLNPILAAGQNLGQMRLKAGDYIPGTGIQITEEDMAVALKEKRYSQAVVATTQGTSKTSPTLIQQNPILIEDQFAGRTIRRGAISPGPLTMARRFSQWGETFSLWWKGISDAYGESGQIPTYAEKRRRITDGEDFQGVLRYVTTTNPEFKNTSKFKPVYEAYTAEARTEADHQVQSLDQLLDRLASIAVSKGMFETTAEAKPEIEAAIIAEMDAQVEAFYAQVIETRQKRPTEVKVESVQAYASANNPFTKARVRMVASDAFYDYTLSTANDRLGFSSSAYQMFQLNQLTEMEKLVQSLTQIQSGLDGEITRLEKQGKGMSRRRAMAIVQKRTRARLGDAKFTYIRLVAFRHTLESSPAISGLAPQTGRPSFSGPPCSASGSSCRLGPATQPPASPI